MSSGDIYSTTEAAGTQTPQLFVGGLSSSTTSSDLFHYFKQYGHVVQCEVRRAESGKSKRFGFVKFLHREDAQSVLAEPSHTVTNKLVTLDWALDPFAKQISQQTRVHRKVYVGSIPGWAVKQDIERVVSKFGRIEKVTRLRKKDDGSLYCYAIMNEISAANELLKRQHVKLDGNYFVAIRKFTPQRNKTDIGYKETPNLLNSLLN